MKKFFDYTKQIFRGKSIYRILFNWQVEKHCRDLDGLCLDLAAGGEPSYYNYLSFSKEAKLIKADNSELKISDMRLDFNQPLALKDNSFDNVLFFNAVYIVRKPEALFREMHRVLKENGRLFVSSPYILNEAKEPDDFRRLTSQGLEEVLKNSGFQKFEIIPFGNRFTAAAFLLNCFFLFNVVRFFACGLAILLDYLVPKNIKRRHPCPLGYFIIAKK